MRRVYFYYVLVLILFSILVLIIWPSTWVNLDIGSFHYHKVWKGPNLSDLSGGRINLDFDLHLGKDFTGGTEYVTQVVFDNPDVDKQVIVEETVDLLRNRLRSAGVLESLVFYTKQGEEFLIHVIIPRAEDETTNKMLITQRGKFEIWGERAEGDTSIVPEEISTDPFRSYLQQQYMDLKVDGNRIKGFRAGREEEFAYIKVALEEDSSNQLGQSIALFWGRSIIGVLDDQPLPIDGGEFAEQVQLYGQPRSLKLIGMSDKEQGKAFGSIIKYGPLPLSLSISDTLQISPQFDRTFLVNSLILAFGTLIFFAIIMFVLFRSYGLIGSVVSTMYLMFILSVLKTFHTPLTIGGVLVIALSLGFLYGLLILKLSTLYELSTKALKRHVKSITNKEIDQLTGIISNLWIVLSTLLVVSSPIFLKYSTSIILICGLALWLSFEAILPICCQLINFVRYKE